MTLVTPTLRTTMRRASFWIGLATAALVLTIVLLLIQGGSLRASEILAPDNPAELGGMAVAEVLGDQGVTVEKAESFDAARFALERLDAEITTVFIVDPEGHLPGDKLRTLSAGAASVVLLAPTSDQLTALVPGISHGGIAVDSATDDEPIRVLDAGCTVRAAENAGRIQGAGYGYRIPASDETIIGCFDAGDGIYAVVQAQHATGSVTVVGSDQLFRNAFITGAGNAAFALTVLGENQNLLWYLPSPRDSGSLIPPTLAELTPSWYTPVALLLVGVVVAIAVWRGRRLGPIVIENLPVVVRASETMEGRARLYQASGSRLHTLDALRIGALGRIATALGLPRTAAVDTIIRSASVLLDRPYEMLHHVLVSETPADDGALVRLSDQLLTLEADIVAATRPGRPLGE